MADLKICNGRYTVDPLYQWDTNQKLKIYGLSILDPRIHFTSEVIGGSLVVEPTVDESGVITVDIPNSLLQFAYPIIVYVTGFEDKTFKTYHKVTIPVKARKRPGDYTLSLSDNEVYSFQAMNKRIADIEKEIQSEGSILYTYTYDADNVNLVEAIGKKTIGQYIPFVSNSLRAIKGITDKFKTMIDDNKKLGDTALAIAKGINQAMVFGTTEDMNAWLSDEANKGKAKVGNNLYIVDVGVPDWWIAEVLDTPDSETGFYYKIAQLETQKVDLTNIESDIDTLQSDVETINSDIDTLQTDVGALKTTVPNKADLDLSNIVNSVFLDKGLSSGLAQVEVKSRTGTGMSSISSINPISMTFSFAPKVVIWLGFTDSNNIFFPPTQYDKYINVVLCDKLSTSYTDKQGFKISPDSNYDNYYPKCKKSSDGKTLTWYTQIGYNAPAQGAQCQLDFSNYEYYFLAIG